MSEPKEQSRAQRLMGDFALKLAELTDDVLYADVWARAELSQRDRSLVTVAALIANGNTEQLPSHLKLAKANGLSETELAEVMTHLAFYAGWPRAVSAVRVAKEVFKKQLETTHSGVTILQGKKSGHIINISSVAGHKARLGGVVYAATKHAVRVISEGVQQEVKPYNIIIHFQPQKLGSAVAAQGAAYGCQVLDGQGRTLSSASCWMATGANASTPTEPG